MKYTTEVTIDLPRERVIELFDSTENLTKWQPTLKSFDHLEGDPGQPGAKSKLVYDDSRRTIEMVETITHRDLPDAFHGTYETKGVWNSFENYFHAEGDKTRWVTHSDFRFSGFMMLVGLVGGAAFRKETLATMNRFKEFAESTA